MVKKHTGLCVTIIKKNKKIRDLLYKQVEEATDTATADSVNTDVFSKLFDKEVLDVYFPLTREGRYGVTYKLKHLLLRGIVKWLCS